MAKVGAQRAAELTGKSKSTIQRAMNSGKLSFELDSNSRRVIDVSELDRVFGLVNTSSSDENLSTGQNEMQKASDMLEMERMKMKIQMLEDKIFAAEKQIEDLKSQRDQWQKQAQQVLITSQYSQKQAEDLKLELKERERKEEERKQKIMEMRMKKLQGQNQNNKSSEAPKSGSEAQQKFTAIWRKIRDSVNTEKVA